MSFWMHFSNLCVQDILVRSSLLHAGVFPAHPRIGHEFAPFSHIDVLSPPLIENRGAGHNGRTPGRARMDSSKAWRRGASGTQLPHRWGSLSTALSHIEGRPAESHRKLEACAGEARCRDKRDILSPLAGLAASSALCCGGQGGLMKIMLRSSVKLKARGSDMKG